MATTLGVKNPYRYRGYLFDTETGLYYLQSRYYNPEIGRFINADDAEVLIEAIKSSTTSNLFFYCGNNFINKSDKSGYFWETPLDIAGVATSVVNFVSKPTVANFGYLAWDVIATALPGVPGSYISKAIKITAKNGAKADDVIKVAQQSYRIASKNSGLKKSSGVYEILFSSGKNYVGKGGFQRMITSGKKISK